MKLGAALVLVLLASQGSLGSLSPLQSPVPAKLQTETTTSSTRLAQGSIFESARWHSSVKLRLRELEVDQNPLLASPPDLTLPDVTITPGEAPSAPSIPPTLQGIDQSLLPIVQRESRGRPYVGYTSPETLRRTGKFTDLSQAPVDDTGAPIWSGDMGPAGISTAFGPAQITRSTWRPIAKRLGITDWRAPGAYAAVANELHREAGMTPWAASAPGREPGVESPQLGSGLTADPVPAAALAAGASVAPPSPVHAAISQALSEPLPTPHMGLLAFGAMLRGMRVSPVDYDPFKIWKLGVTPVDHDPFAGEF